MRSFLCRSISAALGLAFAAPTISPAQAPDGPRVVTDPGGSDGNAAVLSAISTMPVGGTYSVSRSSFDGLTRALTIGSQGLRIDPLVARPSFCSSATYLVFVQALDLLTRRGGVNLDPTAQQALLVSGQRDGQGVWGRWNANGPGTARLFHELQIGRNFTDFAEARRGDFMKIFWNAEIGKKEFGHSVVYLGTNVVGGQEFVRFWSSNKATASGDLSGYGEKLVPRTRIIRAIFSRLDRPANISRVRTLAAVDPFLASMLTRSATIEDVRRVCGL